MYYLEKTVAERPLLLMRFASFFENQSQLMLVLQMIFIVRWIELMLPIQLRSMHY